MQLAIPLSRTGEPLYRQVYSGLRQAILSGVLSANDQLPSTRDLAEQPRPLLFLLHPKRKTALSYKSSSSD